MSQAAAIRRRKQHAKGWKHLPKIGRSRYKSANATPTGKGGK